MPYTPFHDADGGTCRDTNHKIRIDKAIKLGSIPFMHC